MLFLGTETETVPLHAGTTTASLPAKNDGPVVARHDGPVDSPHEVDLSRVMTHKHVPLSSSLSYVALERHVRPLC